MAIFRANETASPRLIHIYVPTCDKLGFAKLVNSLATKKEGDDWNLFFAEDADIPEQLLNPFQCNRVIDWMAALHPAKKYYWPLNDDAIIDTDKWDRAIKALQNGQFGLVGGGLGVLKTGDGQVISSDFPVFTKRHADAFGYLYHPELPWWSGETVWEQVYRQCDKVTKLPLTVTHNRTAARAHRAELLSGDWHKAFKSMDWEEMVGTVKKW